MTYVELSDNKGWIVESASERKVLERSADGQFMVEHITGIIARYRWPFEWTNTCKDEHRP